MPLYESEAHLKLAAKLRNIAAETKVTLEAMRSLELEAAKCSGKPVKPGRTKPRTRKSSSECAVEEGDSARGDSDSSSSNCSVCDLDCWFGCECKCHSSFTVLEECESPENIPGRKSSNCTSPASSLASSSSGGSLLDGPFVDENAIFTTLNGWMGEVEDVACKSCRNRCSYDCECTCHMAIGCSASSDSSESLSADDLHDPARRATRKPKSQLPVDAATSNYRGPKGVLLFRRRPTATLSSSRAPGPQYYNTHGAYLATRSRVKGGHLCPKSLQTEPKDSMQISSELMDETRNNGGHQKAELQRGPFIMPLPSSKPRARRLKRNSGFQRSRGPPASFITNIAAHRQLEKSSHPSKKTLPMKYRRKKQLTPGPGSYTVDGAVLAKSRGSAGLFSAPQYGVGSLIQPEKGSRSLRGDANEAHILEGLNEEQRAKVLDVLDELQREEEEIWRKERGLTVRASMKEKTRHRASSGPKLTVSEESEKGKRPTRGGSSTSSTMVPWLTRLKRAQRNMAAAMTGPGAYDTRKAESAILSKVKGVHLYKPAKQPKGDVSESHSRVAKARWRMRQDELRPRQHIGLGTEGEPDSQRVRKPSFKYVRAEALPEAAILKNAKKKAELESRPIGPSPVTWGEQGVAVRLDLKGREEYRIASKNVIQKEAFGDPVTQTVSHSAKGDTPGPGFYSVPPDMTRTGKARQAPAPSFSKQVARSEYAGPRGEKPEGVSSQQTREAHNLDLDCDTAWANLHPVKGFKFSEDPRWQYSETNAEHDECVVIDAERARRILAPKVPCLVDFDRMVSRGATSDNYDADGDGEGDALNLSVNLDFGRPNSKKGLAPFSEAPRFTYGEDGLAGVYGTGDVLILSANQNFGRPKVKSGAFPKSERWSSSDKEQNDGNIDGDALILSANLDYGKQKARMGVPFHLQGERWQTASEYKGADEAELIKAEIREELRRNESIERLLLPQPRQVVHFGEDY